MPRRWYEDYERGRPGYPPELVDLVGLPASATVVDLAAGTGKLTRVLASRFAHVIAVEPDENMRRLLVTHCPEATVVAGTAEQIPLADASVDAVFAAQSFHWFDNERVLAEVVRVMRSAGALVVVWNVPTGPAQPSITSVGGLLADGWPDDCGFPLDLSLSDWAPGVWELPSAQSRFERHREARLPNPQTIVPEGLVAFFGSMGWIASLPDHDRLPLLDQVRSLLTATSYVLPWETRVNWTRLTDGVGVVVGSHRD